MLRLIIQQNINSTFPPYFATSITQFSFPISNPTTLIQYPHTNKTHRKTPPSSSAVNLFSATHSNPKPTNQKPTVNPTVINTPKAEKIPICFSDRRSAGLNLVVHQHHTRPRRTTGLDLMTLAPPPCAPSSRCHQVAPMVLNSHLAITKLDLIDGSEN
jgi:hypothetical protein